jgi:hypothetical protein
MVSPYLVMGATNPTPYQYLLAGVSPEHQVDEALRILEARRTPYIISWIFAPRPADRIAQYIREHYEPVPLAPAGDERSVYVLYRRK